MNEDRPFSDEPFSPDTVDEQLDQLLALPGQDEAVPAQARFIKDLSALASEQVGIRDRVLARLLARAESVEHTSRPVTTAKKQKTSGERMRVMAQDGLYPKRTGRQRVAMVAAVIVTAAVVGSMLLLLSLAGRHGTQTAGQVMATTTPTPAVQAYCKLEQGWYTVCSTGQDTALNITKTINGNTFILHAAYADNNRVIIAYTQKYPANAPAHPQPGLANMTLTMQQGTQLPDAGWSGMFDAKAKAENDIASFNTAAIAAGTHTLNLHLQITLHAVTGSGQVKTVGTTSASFSVPFHTGRVANLNQTVTVNHIAITLQKVVVSPTETRLYVLSNRLQVVGGSQGNPYSLVVGNWNTGKYGFDGEEVMMPAGKSGPFVGIILTEYASLINEQGQWTLQITSGAISGGSGNGTWVFHFTVPA